MMNTMKKAVASGLLITTIASTTNEAYADATAVMEVAKETSMACPYIAPVVITGAAVITAATTIIGIKNKTKQTNDYIYQSLQHLPDHWKPNSVIEKLNPNGRIVQRRFYGPTGKPEFDVDLTNHGTPEYHPFGHGGAHKHNYKYGRRQRGVELTDEEYQRYVKDFDSKAADRMRVKYIPDNK